jgi:hypothetical protein
MVQLECHKLSHSQIEKVQVNSESQCHKSVQIRIDWSTRTVIFRMKYVQMDSLECSKLCQSQDYLC